MAESGNPHMATIGGSNEAVVGEEQRAVMGPTPVRRPLSVKITNREQIERLTPAQKQKLMRMVIAKRQLAAQQDDGGEKENAGEDGAVSALKLMDSTLEKRGSNRFPAPTDSSPGAKRQKTVNAVASALKEHVSKVETPLLAYSPHGCNPPSISELTGIRYKVESMIKEAREALLSGQMMSKGECGDTWQRRTSFKVHMRLVFRDGTELVRCLSSMTQLFDEVPRILVERQSSTPGVESEAHLSPGQLADPPGATRSAGRPTHSDLVKSIRMALSELYSTHSRKLLDDFKAAHDIRVLEINGTDPSTLPLGLDMYWHNGRVRTDRIGIVDLRAFRTGKALEDCLFYATSVGQAWDVMYELRPLETLHLNWRMRGANTFSDCKLSNSELVRNNELFYAPLDIDAKDISGFDYGAMKSLWSSTVSDDEKRGILRCLKFHFVPSQ